MSQFALLSPQVLMKSAYWKSVSLILLSPHTAVATVARGQDEKQLMVELCAVTAVAKVATKSCNKD